MPIQRLDKIISDSGRATRSQARDYIKSGRVRVDGAVVTQIDGKFDSDAQISLDELPIRGGKRYIMLNKPEGVLSASEDREQKTVIDLLPPELKGCGLFPVGRLDKDTRGLLILTNDGDFCHAVTSPKSHIRKLYEAFTDQGLKPEDCAAFEKGLTLRDGTQCLPAKLIIDENETNHVFVELFEGKYHQIKRMLASRGATVQKLCRLEIGGLRLDENLAAGQWRELSKEELSKIVYK
ncbi:MAG: pseudouridine synthase [Oscillospiraceae bacterium]